MSSDTLGPGATATGTCRLLTLASITAASQNRRHNEPLGLARRPTSHEFLLLRSLPHGSSPSRLQAYKLRHPRPACDQDRSHATAECLASHVGTNGRGCRSSGRSCGLCFVLHGTRWPQHLLLKVLSRPGPLCWGPAPSPSSLARQMNDVDGTSVGSVCLFTILWARAS
jgi:hypothetical protein